MKKAELFEELLARPALYVGHPSIILIRAFLDGFDYAHVRTEMEKGDLYSGFNEWVANRFSIRTAHDWSSIIAFMGQSESAAFELAKELWQEYKTSRIKD